MDKSTLSNYGWVVIVTLVLAVMLALVTPFGSYVGKGASNVIKTFVNTSDDAIDEDNIDTMSKDWDKYLNDSDKYHNDVVPEGGTYTDTSDNEYVGGDSFPKDVEVGDSYVYGNYKYNYTNTENSPGWFCRAIAPTEEGVIFESPLTYINDKPVTRLVGTFASCDLPYKLADDFRIPETVIMVQQMFNGSLGLSELPNGFTVPNNVKTCSIMFQHCANLKRLPEGFSIPSHITDIHWMFLGCSSLENIPASLTFDNVQVCVGAFAHCASLTEIPETFRFPNGKDVSLQSFFNGCTSLKKLPSDLIIPENVVAIPYLFQDCTSLETLPKSFIIHENIASASCAFKGCTNLTGTIVINANMPDENEYSYIDSMFTDTVKPITITGTSTRLNDIAATANNGNVTVK